MAIFRSCVKFLMLAGLVWQFAANGWAQGYPAKAVRLLVPFPAGSGSDTFGRIIAGGLAEAFGQQVIVDNRPGAAGNIGAAAAAKAPADGYTLLQATLTHTVNVSLYRKLSYDLVRDFAPVTQLGASPYVVIVHPSLPVRSITELVKLAKARPGAIDYASAGAGTATFFATELFKDMAGINLTHVPYRGGGEAMTSIISGETSVQFAPLAIALPLIREGRFRPLAVTTAGRLPVLPEHPAIAEIIPGYALTGWFGIMVPVKTPAEIIAVIHKAAMTALRSPRVSRSMADLGYVSIGDQPADFAAHIRSEIDRLGRIVRRAGLSAD